MKKFIQLIVLISFAFIQYIKDFDKPRNLKYHEKENLPAALNN
jgi:hypothetical protein